MQTEWSRGWAYAVIGFAEAAKLLTEQRGRLHATVDQAGLVVFYLQRHRMELVMKLALDQLGVEQTEIAGLDHDLARAWARFGVAVCETTVEADWQRLVKDFGEFVAAIDEADRGSFNYRYPIDKAGRESRRAPYIDLEALERWTHSFESAIEGYTDMVDFGNSEAAWIR